MGLASQESLNLETRAPNVSLNNVSVPNAVALLLERTHLSGGIVDSFTCDDPSPYTFKISGMTLRQALDYVVGLDSRYGWHVQDDMIIVSKRNLRAELLDTRISSLNALHGKYLIDAVSGLLLQTSEVRNKAAALHLTRTVQQGRMIGADEPIIHVELHDVTVRQALDAIARQDGHAVWRYYERHCDKENEFNVDWLVH